MYLTFVFMKGVKCKQSVPKLKKGVDKLYEAYKSKEVYPGNLSDAMHLHDQNYRDKGKKKKKNRNDRNADENNGNEETTSETNDANNNNNIHDNIDNITASIIMLIISMIILISFIITMPQPLEVVKVVNQQHFPRRDIAAY